MQRQTLASALNAALKQQTQTPVAPKASNTLLTALQNSATPKDKIIQRRIGLDQEPVCSTK
jgi:hypothetical protein